MTDVVGLCLQPPEHAIVLSVDEKTSVQALERTQPPLPLRTGRAVRHTHDYRRHAVLDLFAACLRFMQNIVRACPDRELHVVLDNSSTHNTEEVRAWLGATRACSSTTRRRARRG